MTQPDLEFEIVPHVGIGPVRLGMLPAEVESALAPFPAAFSRQEKRPPRITISTIHCSSNLQPHRGRQLHSGFGTHARHICRYRGKDVFDLPAPSFSR